MLRRLFWLFSKLVGVAFCFVLVTVGWIIFEGLDDIGDRADVGLVVDWAGDPAANDPALERAARLFRDGTFNRIIVCATAGGEPQTAARFLQAHGVTDSAIILGGTAPTQGEAVANVAALMKSDGLRSVMVVADYYRITRIKVELLHNNVEEIDSSHVRSVGISDALGIAYEVVALYDYIGRTYLLPTGKKLESEASTEAAKAREQAQKAGDAIQKHLDDMPK